MMYHRHSFKGGWYETIMRPFVIFYRFRHDLGTDPSGYICFGGHCDHADDPGI